jgi:protein-disulfide isomerase
LVEFGDFQCPACGVAYPVARKIKEEYAGRINFVFRHYPLQGHLNAFNAAMAAESAANQGKFWEMHDKLYEKQKEWSDSDKWLDIFIKYAKDLGLDIEKFKTDMNDTRLGERIRADQTDGNAAGLTATPTFYLNGEMLVGVPDYGKLKEKIDKLL